MIIEVIQIMLFCISFPMLVWFLLFPRAEYYTDLYRHNLFVLRDSLFDNAEKYGIAFDSEAYKAVRELMNSYLRFAHHMSFLKLAVVAIVTRCTGSVDQVRKIGGRVKVVLDDLPANQREYLFLLIFRLHMTTLVHVFQSSLFLNPLFSCLRWASRFIGYFRKMSKKIQSSTRWDEIDGQTELLSLRLG